MLTILEKLNVKFYPNPSTSLKKFMYVIFYTSHVINHITKYTKLSLISWSDLGNIHGYNVTIVFSQFLNAINYYGKELLNSKKGTLLRKIYI